MAQKLIRAPKYHGEEYYPATTTEAVADRERNASLAKVLKDLAYDIIKNSANLLLYQNENNNNVGIFKFPTFSTSVEYKAGDVVVYANHLRKCKADTTAGKFDDSKFQMYSIKEYADDVVQKPHLYAYSETSSDGQASSAQIQTKGGAIGRLWKSLLEMSQQIKMSVSGGGNASVVEIASGGVAVSTPSFDLSETTEIFLSEDMELRTVIENFKDGLSELNDVTLHNIGISLFPIFSDDKDYVSGDIVRSPDGYLYRFIQTHSGAWNEDHVEEWTLKNDYETIRAVAENYFVTLRLLINDIHIGMANSAPSEPISDITTIL